jgi:hypothetical protein
MYPAIIAAAFFTAVLLNDLAQNQKPMEIGKHVFFGVLAVFGLWALEYRDMGIVAWGLLVIPAVVFASSLLYTVLNPPPAPKPLPPAPAPAPAPKPEPEEPVVQLPDENTVCVELEFDPSKPKPAPLPSCEVGADGTIGMPGTLPKPTPAPSCPSDIIGGVSAGSLSGRGGSSTSASSTTQTLEDLLKSMNKSLTPVTVCPGA